MDRQQQEPPKLAQLQQQIPEAPPRPLHPAMVKRETPTMGPCDGHGLANPYSMPVPPRPQTCAMGQPVPNSTPSGTNFTHAAPNQFGHTQSQPMAGSTLPDGPQHGFGQTPMHPTAIMSPPVVDPCPAFTPSTYQHWKREVKLRMAGFPTANASHLLPKVIAVLPPTL